MDVILLSDENPLCQYILKRQVHTFLYDSLYLDTNGETSMKQQAESTPIEETPEYVCGVAVTLELIGGKWKGVILWHLSHKTLRFSQLKRRLSGVTQKMLTQQLRDLETNGLINRKVFAEVPPRVEYSLTEKGRTLQPILHQMCDWGTVQHKNERLRIKA
jgi:DNA-binding HxlR family transcriptional regulator